MKDQSFRFAIFVFAARFSTEECQEVRIARKDELYRSTFFGSNDLSVEAYILVGRYFYVQTYRFVQPVAASPKEEASIQMAMSLYVFIIYDAFIDEYCDYQPGLFCVISLLHSFPHPESGSSCRCWRC